MALVELLTKSDLENFKKELLADLAELLAKKGTADNKKWLRTAEVRKLLGGFTGYAPEPSHQRYAALHESRFAVLL